MKICFIGPANSAHIVKWCTWFTQRGHEVHVISFTPGEIENTHVHLVDTGVDAAGSDLGKIKYLLSGKKIRRIAESISPDVINVHYATSYGAAAALSGLKNYALSVWGSDIYEFPGKSALHKALLKYSLRKAGRLFSTSRAMAREAQKYTDREFDITPFGVDMDLFNPDKRHRSGSSFVFGTVKTLSSLYGIEYILDAAAILKSQHPEIEMQVRISGDGPDRGSLQKHAEDLGIDDMTVFLGRISQQQAADEYANMDVAVIPSVHHESFGVSAVEAQACSIPVIISDVDGLMETTVPGESSIVTPRRDAASIAKALFDLFADPEKRKRMGAYGRKYVTEKYELKQCFEEIEKLLETIVKTSVR